MSAVIPFTKMHGIGNDCVIVDARERAIDLGVADLRHIADRHRGVGCDQIVVLAASVNGDAKLEFFNSDGSGAQACGNATRCCGLYLRDQGLPQSLLLESDAGMLAIEVESAERIRVEMPSPRLLWHEIPLARACDTLEVPIGHENFPDPVAVNMGNPHLVFFVDDADAVAIDRLGPALEIHALLPERGNIGFANLISADTIRLRVFERGSGQTLACGSGACAALVAAVRRRLVDDHALMVLDGGELEIAWPGEGPVVMTGPAAYACEGQLALPETSGDR